MKPIKEMNLAECLEEFFEQRQLELYSFGSTWRQVLVDRIHELTRWIPVEERLPTKEDGSSVVTINKNMKCCITLWHNIDKLNVPATYWRRIDKP